MSWLWGKSEKSHGSSSSAAAAPTGSPIRRGVHSTQEARIRVPTPDDDGPDVNLGLRRGNWQSGAAEAHDGGNPMMPFPPFDPNVAMMFGNGSWTQMQSMQMQMQMPFGYGMGDNMDAWQMGGAGYSQQARGSNNDRKGKKNNKAQDAVRPAEARTGATNPSSESDISQKGHVSTWGVTVMLKNLPNDYRRDALLRLLDKHGFFKRYNFVYLPVDFNSGSGLGYAFVNMVDHEAALEVIERLDGHHSWEQLEVGKDGGEWKELKSQKVCEVAWGDPEKQGYEKHIELYQNSPVLHHSLDGKEKLTQYRPLVFQDGRRREMTEIRDPSKAIRRPRIKNKSRKSAGDGDESPAPEGSDEEN